MGFNIELNIGFNIAFIIGLNIRLNIGLNIRLNIGVQYWAQYWVQYWVQYWDSILGSILGSISILDVPMNLRLKFHQNRISNSWDIGNIEFLWWGGGWGGGVVCKVIFMSNPTLGYVRLSWVAVELGVWQNLLLYYFIIWTIYFIFSLIQNILLYQLGFHQQAKMCLKGW